MTWEIVVGLIALVGFGISVTTPNIKLNTSITKQNCSIDALNKNMDTSNKRLDAHSKELDDHEHRITVLEGFHKKYIGGEEEAQRWES